MQTPPPFLVNSLLFGGRLGPVPAGLWQLFCDRATANAMLLACSMSDPAAVLVDVIHDKTIPAGAERLPSDVSAYMIVGSVPLKNRELPPALLSEFAGWLADAKAGTLPIPEELDVQAQNIQGHPGKSHLFPYVSVNDPQNSDLYWADSPVLGGISA